MKELLIGIGITLAGSFLNFIATKVYNAVTGAYRNFIWRVKEGSIERLEIDSNYEDIRKRVRIVVIDDDNFFPTQLFLDSGYSIEKWDTVKDYAKLERGFYDIIILDIYGVAQHISAEDGMGVLKSLKKTNPSQIIVANSGQSFDFNQQLFWELADYKLPKPIDFLKTKEVIDDLINEKFKPDRYISSITRLLVTANYSNNNINKIKEKAAIALKKGIKPDWSKIIGGNASPDLISQLSSVSESLVKFYKHGN